MSDLNDATKCSVVELAWRTALEPAIMLMADHGVDVLELQIRVPEVKLFLDGNGSVTAPLRVARTPKFQPQPIKLIKMEFV